MTAQHVCRLAGVAPRTLDFWVRSRVISPSICKAAGTGSKRHYSNADLAQCKLAVILRAMGMETSRFAPILKLARSKQTAFIIIEANGQVTAIPKTTGLSTFQANRTAMLLVNIAAIKAELTLESE